MVRSAYMQIVYYFIIFIIYSSYLWIVYILKALFVTGLYYLSIQEFCELFILLIHSGNFWIVSIIIIINY